MTIETAVADALPALLCARVLESVRRACALAGGDPADAESCRTALHPPVASSARAFSALARRAARVDTRIQCVGSDRRGTLRWWAPPADSPAEPAPAPAPRGLGPQLERIAAHVARLRLARPSERPLDAIERLLAAQPAHLTPSPTPAPVHIEPPAAVQAPPAASPPPEPEHSHAVPSAVGAAADPAPVEVTRPEPAPALDADSFFRSMQRERAPAAVPVQAPEHEAQPAELAPAPERAPVHVEPAPEPAPAPADPEAPPVELVWPTPVPRPRRAPPASFTRPPPPAPAIATDDDLAAAAAALEP